MIDQQSEAGFRASVSIPNYQDWRESSTVFDRFAFEVPSSFRVDGEDGTEVIDGMRVLGDYFQVFGVNPALGRLPTSEELGPGAEPIVVLSHTTWMTRLGGRSDVIGSTFRIGVVPYRVVGVLPAGFEMDPAVALYTPLGLDAARLPWNDRNSGFGGRVVARLRAGVDASEARADLARVDTELEAVVGDDVDSPFLVLLRDWYVGDVRTSVLLVLLASVLVLLVAAANVAALLLSRAEARRAEISLRVALGASGGRVLRQLFVESLVLGVLGAAAGLILARVTLQGLIGSVGSTLPPGFLARVEMGPIVVGATLAVSLLLSVAFSLAPVLAHRARGLSAVTRSKDLGGRSTRVRGALVAGEVALSIVLLVMAGLVVRSVGNLRGVDTGFQTEGVLTMRVSVPGSDYPNREAAHAVQQEIRSRVEALPGVQHAGLSNLFPFSQTNWEMLFRESTRWPAEEGRSVLYTSATPEYFAVYGIELVRGRLIEAGDVAESEPVVVIDETAVEAYWPGEDPIGRTVAVDDVAEGDAFVPRWRRVVGVVRHVRNYELTEPSRIEAYVPLAQSPACCSTLWLTVRTAGDPAALADPVRGVIGQVNPSIATYRTQTMASVISAETATHRAVRTLFAVFGGLALLLSAVGIYGVVAYNTARRTREIGLRVAIGAEPRQVATRVAFEGLQWVFWGVTLGLAVATVAARALGSLLFEVGPLDGVTFATAAAVLTVAALIAAWLPARRAASLDPAAVLRQE
jgi:predicted permease